MIFITYPRSGVNFLTRAIFHQTGIEISYQHSLNEAKWKNFKDRNVDESEDYIINIVRDPSESMVSWLSMQYEMSDVPLLNNGFEKIIKSKSILQYKKLYKKLLSLNNVIFIDYKDVNNTEKLLSKLYEILNLEIINNNVNFEEITKKMKDENPRLDSYLISSKQTTKYNEYRDIIKGMDLSECYDLYHQALAKCIKI